MRSEQKPLFGKKILITRSKQQAASFSNKVQELGGIPIQIPLISIQQPSTIRPVTQAISKLDTFHWIIFTSTNGVKFFLNALKEESIDTAILKNNRIAVVGRKTLEVLEDAGIKVDLVPTEFVAEALIDELKQQMKEGEAVLLPRGNLARDVLPNELRKLGASVTDIVVYETVLYDGHKQELYELIKNKQIDVVTFTSSSTVHHFVQLLEGTDWRNYIDSIILAAIGPITAETLEHYHLIPTVTAEQYTINGLLHSIVEIIAKGDSDYE
ncbi:uroporphyrinogen-III synthase [Bacillus taeanensis]|uniref:Uroporphyrinogen-III synthase n=1 Tax=Bacillus taeanensis TaxID=273032 RepID=A0A366Y058_9BACI|nr:uroporphyrinogen-III synthase [Bacillus taeanensis]RBW71577.1 uroporphyrinogen-III synthase [Bacillus taeanensis]